MNHIFIAGCGYIGQRIGELWHQQGAAVIGLNRSQESLAGVPWEVLSANLDDPATIVLPSLDGYLLYYLAPPPGGGFKDTRADNFIAVMRSAGKPQKIIYMSATSVYSETQGGVVSEESPTEPTSAMGKRRCDAEQRFKDYGAEQKVPVIILRVSGIYGPGRLPLMQVSQGLPLLREEESGPSNRIHADDLAAVCVAAAGLTVNDIINVSDGHPSSMTSYFNACADLLGYPKAPQVSREEARKVMSPLMYAYSAESRVVDNRRMVERLGITLRYPTWAEGLPACL